MSETPDRARRRPSDPAGTQPKHEPESLLPTRRTPLLRPRPDTRGPDAVDEGARPFLPERRGEEGAGAVGEPASARHSGYAPRFQFLTGALIAIGVAAVAGLAALAIGLSGGDGSDGGTSWSAWRPSSGGTDGAQEVAQHIAGEYRQGGEQLVNVKAEGLEYNGVPLSVAVRQDAAHGGAIKIYDDDGILFELCGLGPSCSIDRGKPSTERHLLLRREAFELALYSFRYLGVNQVVTFLPPAPGKAPTQALYFRKDDVQAELGRPLTASLASRAPTVSSVTLSPDATLVEQVTTRQLFLFSLTGSNFDNRGFIVLDPYTKEGDLQRQTRIEQQAQGASGATTAGAGSSAAGSSASGSGSASSGSSSGSGSGGGSSKAHHSKKTSKSGSGG
jgi:hypothetical protein